MLERGEKWNHNFPCCTDDANRRSQDSLITFYEPILKDSCGFEIEHRADTRRPGIFQDCQKSFASFRLSLHSYQLVQLDNLLLLHTRKELLQGFLPAQYVGRGS